MSYEESKLLSLLKKQDIDSLFLEATNYLCQTKSLFEEKKQLQQENEILKENAENNDKVIDKVNWENMLLKKENKQLKDNWIKLKEYVNKHYDYYMNEKDYIGGRLCFGDMKNNMQELEQGRDNQ